MGLSAGTSNEMEIRIGKPYICEKQGCISLCAELTIGERPETAWFSVGSEFGQYLTDDRTDAFVVGFLTTAMRLGADIVCDAPVTRRLKYQLEQYLIPSMAANMEIYHSITIHAPVTDAVLPCAGAVGTGWTGGVDCMYTLMEHLDSPGHQVTHLLITNNGALEGDDNSALLRLMMAQAKTGIAADCGLSVIGVDSNLQEIQDERYLAVAGFRLPAVVLAVQKLFGVFLNSAGYDFSRFAFVPENSAYYELLLMQCFETDCTAFYSSGGGTPRIRKLQELADFPPARKYLHPCIYASGNNCGKCGKCVRTQAALYALGRLEDFRKVFDIEAFERNKEDILAQILAKRESQHYGEVLHVLKQKGEKLSPAVQRRARILRAAEVVAKRKQDDGQLNN